MTAQNEQTTLKIAEDPFTCDCGDRARSACAGEKFFKEHDGKRYCVLHYPGQDKLEEFRAALKRKLDVEDFDFGEVWFPEGVNFSGTAFSADTNFKGTTFGAKANFMGATFSVGASFESAIFCAGTNFKAATFGANANFFNATFSADANFFNATFRAVASFNDATFSADANFTRATFSAKASFESATFCADAYLNGATFSAKASFFNTTFKSYVHFDGSDQMKVFGKRPHLNFQFAPIEKPERISFHTLQLRPHWFINVDCRKFEFTDVDWDFRLKEELKRASDAGVSTPYRLLAITLRQLADNAEANHRYYEASRFRYNAFEARRIEKFGGFVPWRLDWWYWLASGYGESVGRAFIVFVVLLTLFAFGYTRIGFEQGSKPPGNSPAQPTASPTMRPDTAGKPLGWREAAIYSFDVSILQKPEPKPLTLTAKALVSLETVLGPAQAALLALAVRRRFMR